MLTIDNPITFSEWLIRLNVLLVHEGRPEVVAAVMQSSFDRGLIPEQALVGILWAGRGSKITAACHCAFAGAVWLSNSIACWPF